LYQFNAGTMTMRTENATLLPGDFLHISPEDARDLSLADRERVRVRGRHGQATLPLRIDPSIQAGSLFATFHTADVFLNALTTLNADAYTTTPEYKVTAVRVEKL
jgi:formate dehydrogenase major subunit